MHVYGLWLLFYYVMDGNLWYYYAYDGYDLTYLGCMIMRCMNAHVIYDVANMFVDAGCMCMMYAYMICSFFNFSCYDDVYAMV